MASEDSDELCSGLPAVHGLCDLSDLDETRGRQMTPVVDHPHDLSELLEVRSLRGAQRMIAEERNDRFHEVNAPADHVAIHVFTVIVVSPVRDHAAHPEE